jgi:hypothetical protein
LERFTSYQNGHCSARVAAWVTCRGGAELLPEVTRPASLPLSAFCCRSWLFRKRMQPKFSFLWLQKCQIDFIPKQIGGGAFFSFHFHLKAV